MSYFLDIRYTGLEELVGTVIALGPAAANRFFPPVLAAAAKVVRRETRSGSFTPGPYSRTNHPLVSEHTRNLRKSVRIARVPSTYFGRRYRYGRVSLYAGRRNSTPEVRQAYLVHEGTAQRRTSSGRSTGAARPFPYIRNAIQRSEGAQIAAVRQEAASRLPKVIEYARRQRGVGGNRTIATARSIVRRRIRR